ncbi:hypothetical protein Sa4125_43390 [Aureimonas sp. SA4125]|uniref:TraB/GumN family protein n=1 Tax=Aureimonas sp. SA4125 TaxID=2826993 RepID=UPI001CC48B54|nr:TraB/GumN family protein [Aureimonas sp. SA4125]BDA86797.1 hypothetical protein Sa4125_43390 [Aureimonas sp. SA4125]
MSIRQVETSGVFQISSSFKPLLRWVFPFVSALVLSAGGATALAKTQGDVPATPAIDGNVSAATPCRGRDLIPELVRSGRYAAMEEAAAGIANGRGKLYRIEHEGIAASTLFGTMHLSDKRLAPGPRARAEFRAAETLVIETTESLDPAATTAALLARPDLLYLPQGQTMGDRLTAPQAAAVAEGLERRGVPPASVETLQPWFLAVSLMLPACETQRLARRERPLDLALAALAKAEGKPVLGLESGAEQLEALASMSMDLQVSSLLSTLALGDRLPDLFETMTLLYLGGRIALIAPLAEAILPPDSTAAARDAAAFEKRLVTDRNHLMAERLEPLLQRGGAFVAVGALHLPGDEGLVALLRAKGYRLTRLD